jgi:predicted SprT family Zn-dependent metalloprotease
MTTSEAWATIRYACECLGRPDVALLIRLEWSNRMTRAMGKVTAKMVNYKYRIRLSTKLFALATPEQQRQTVIHEACHVLDRVINSCPMSHGPTWKACMVKCGVKPNVYTEGIDNSSIRPKLKRFEYVCSGCGYTYKLTSGKHRKAKQSPGRYHCHKCHSGVEFTGRLLMV